MSLSLVSNPYLEETSSKIRFVKVPWEGYQRAGHVTTEELSLIKKVAQQTKSKNEPLLLSEGPAYTALYLRLLKKLQRVDTMQYHDERVPLFTRAAELDPELPYVPLLRALESQDEFVQLKAAQILAILLRFILLFMIMFDGNTCRCSSPSTVILQHHLQAFLKILASLVQGVSPNKREIAVQCVEAILSRSETRHVVWAVPGILVGLVNVLKCNPGPQMSYQVAFCFWLLSFRQDIAEELNGKYDVIPLLTDTARVAVKEKVIRVIMATFRNLVTKAPAANLPAMLVAQLLPFVKNLSTRKWTDEDILEDVVFLRDELNQRFQSLTTYDEYTSELASGHLSWTPVHESDDFWKENAAKLNERDYQQLRLLINILNSATEPVVLAVAVHDVGQYVKHYDRGKKVVTQLGAKERVMDLMTHENSDVRYRALISVQQLISQPWVMT
ncbi:hypothetical protein AX16_008670 [Volvariella volvacea WC 439]|nr:hypothetical protein AX16_008670 [Volvariella volvacea WC 439]